jgi:hypothetical protein
MKQPDRRDDCPPLPRCDLCRKPFIPWRVRDVDWNLLPSKFHPMVLCLGHYFRLIVQNGHDPGQVSVSHEPWRRLRALWPIHLHRLVHIVLDGEIRQAKVAYIINVRQVRVRLLDGGSDAGSEVVARWDGETRHPRTGRPVLRAAE